MPHDRRRPVPPARPAPTRHALLAAAVLLTAFNLRTAVTSIGPVLSEVQQGVGMSSAWAGVLTSLPVVCFAVVGWWTPSAAHRFGDGVVVLAALALSAVGLAGRATAGSAPVFLGLSLLALVGGAAGNVLLPVLVKRHFPGSVGAMTAAYTTAMASGATAAAALTVPLGDLLAGAGWRAGLGVWAVPAALAAGLAAFPAVSAARRRSRDRLPRVVSPVFRSPTAWALAVFFGTQSLQAYVAFGWFGRFYREEAGATAAEAGLLIAALNALSIPVSALVPWLAGRAASLRPMVVVHVLCYAAAYAVMLTAPGGGAWLSVVLLSVGAGAFPLSLTMIVLRARSPEVTGSVSAFAQSVGYVIAGAGPLAVGVVLGATQDWTVVLLLLLAVLLPMLVAGWRVGRRTVVDDEVGAAAPARTG